MSLDGIIHYTYRPGSFILAHNDDPSGKKIKKVFKEIKEVWREKGWKSAFPASFDKEERRLVLDLTPSQLTHLASFHQVFRNFIGKDSGKTIFRGYDSMNFTYAFPELDLYQFGQDAALDLKRSQLTYVTPSIPKNADECTPLATVTRWLSEDQYQGVIVGEEHRFASAHNLLIHNMETLKSLGVATLFLEFLGIEEQAALDQYMGKEGDNVSLPPQIAAIINDYDRSAKLPEGGRLVDVILAAKKVGIRIVGIETEASKSYGNDYYLGHSTDDNLRTIGLNYVAQAIIRSEKGGGKYVVLVGNTHVSRFKNVPGLSELLGAPGLLIFAKPEAHDPLPRLGFNRMNPFPGLNAIYHAVFEEDKPIDLTSRSDLASTIIQNMNRPETHNLLLHSANGSWLARTSDSKPGTFVLAIKSTEKKVTQYPIDNFVTVTKMIKKLELNPELQIT